MANVNAADKNRNKLVAALTLTPQTTCPIALGSEGLWLDGSAATAVLKQRTAAGTDTEPGESTHVYDPVRLVDTSVLSIGGGGNYVYDATALTLTHKSNNTQATIDSVAPGIGDRVIRQIGDTSDGIYSYTRLKDTSIKAQWTRVADLNSSGAFVNGGFVAVTAGTSFANTLWELTFTAPFTLDSSTPLFTQTATAVTATAVRSAIAATQATTPAFTGTAYPKAGFIAYVPPAAEAAAVNATISVNANLVSAAPITIGAQPSIPCKLNFFVTDANSSCSGTIAVVGVGPAGEAATETIAVTAQGTHTYQTAKAYATLTSATPTIAGIDAGTDKLAVGQSTAIGLPIPAAAASVAVYKEAAAATLGAAPVNETVGTVDATARTVIPSTNAFDGTKAWFFWFSYTLTPLGSVASHTHAL